MPEKNTALLTVEGLQVQFHGGNETITAVDGVSFHLQRGETLALVGESGSGKTAIALALMRLLPPSAQIQAQTIHLGNHELTHLNEEGMRRLRGDRIAMVFQEPMTALNPLLTVAIQVMEPLLLHRNMPQKEAHQECLDLLTRTGLPDPQRVASAYPHQLSGGQRQRVLIAMALACRPDLLIADEPTTALDVTIQAQILDLLRDLREAFGMALLLITHDLPMVRRMADRVCVMHHGKIVESGTTPDLFANPCHPYTRMLLGSLPATTPPPAPTQPQELYQASQVRCHFPLRRSWLGRVQSWVKAVDGVELVLRRGETVGVVGESGSGKSTLGEALLRLNNASGQFHFEGVDLLSLSRRALNPMRRRMQVVFQDPFSSLSPRMTVAEILAEGLEVHGLEPNLAARHQRIAAMLTEVGLEPTMVGRYPHEFSGGQRQRIAIARAMALQPDLLILDEPTSALDLSVQAQILALLRRLQQVHGLAYLFISHDLRVIRAMAHHIVVMKAGQVVEQGPAARIFAQPQQPYTRALLAAALGEA